MSKKRFSISKISTFMECAARYHHKYVMHHEGVKSKSEPATRGSILHTTIEAAMHQLSADGVYNWNVVDSHMANVQAYLADEDEAAAEIMDTYGPTARIIVHRLLDQLRIFSLDKPFGDEWRDMHIEEKLSSEYEVFDSTDFDPYSGGTFGHSELINLEGYPDLIATIDSVTTLIDWKTVNNLPKGRVYGRTYHRFQLGVYIALARNAGLMKPDPFHRYMAEVILVRGNPNIAKKDTTPVFARKSFIFSEQAVGNYEKLALDWIEKILYSGHSLHSMNWMSCDNCAFTEECHREFEGQSAFLAVERVNK